MTYFPKTKIEFDDGSSVDAFSRLRVSSLFTLFESKQIIDDQPLDWSTKYVQGATGSWNSTRASTTLSVSSASGSHAIRQTRRRMTYQPGKSLQTLITAIMGTGSAGIQKNIGYFDDSGGVFFSQDQNNNYVVKRSKIDGVLVNTFISQSQWSLDKLDGSGSSGVTLDMSKAQIFVIDMQWLGTGRVRIGFNFDGITTYVHEFLHSNRNTSVYMQTPNLPIRCEINNFSG
jgi:hypothetical protein